MNVEIILLGNTPLLLHNPLMSDPEYPLARELKSMTTKKKKTDEDMRRIEHLEWHGGLYTGEVEGRACVVQPTSKVRKCLINTARISKLGKQVERALITTSLNVPLIYGGSEKAKDLDAELRRLSSDPAYSSRLSVRVGNKRVMRVRPQFMPWALIVPAVLVPDAGLNFDEFERIVALAGIAERIGDNRVNGYGGFLGHVRAVTAHTKPLDRTISGIRSYFDSLEKKGEAA